MLLSVLTKFASIDNCAAGTADNNTCLTNLPTVQANQAALTQFLSIIFGVIAAVAVLIIVIQGIKFALTQGDPQKAADARKSIIYTVVGLGVSVSAELIVRLVIGKL